MSRILIVDDDPRLRDLLRVALERAEHEVMVAADGQIAITHVARHRPDLIVLDVGLPEMDGFETCRRIRATSDVPILFLTTRDDEIDRILGLEMGADDYVTKPFSPRELVARVRAIIKRTNCDGGKQILRHGLIQLNRDRRSCEISGEEIGLTGTEFELLVALLLEAGRLLPRIQLINRLWGAHSPVSDRTLDSHLRNLRRKLSDAGYPDAIETLHGQGVRIRSAT